MYAAPGNIINIDISHLNTRGHSLKLQKPRCSTTMRLNTFPHRCIDQWNSLPEEVVSAPSLNSFKARLDRHWAEEIYTY